MNEMRRLGFVGFFWYLEAFLNGILLPHLHRVAVGVAYYKIKKEVWILT